MEVLTIEHSAFQQLISKIEAMDEFIRKAKLEQQSSLDDDWVDGQAVCEYLCICDKTLQRLRSAGKITYSTILKIKQLQKCNCFFVVQICGKNRSPQHCSKVLLY